MPAARCGNPSIRRTRREALYFGAIAAGQCARMSSHTARKKALMDDRRQSVGSGEREGKRARFDRPAARPMCITAACWGIGDITAS
jgi:hypothetical protein